MAQSYGDTPLNTALTRLGVKPETPLSPKDHFDNIARKTRVPANLLMALDGGRADRGGAERNAQFLSGAIQGGSSIEDAVTTLTGDETRTRALIGDSYKIADALYPAAPSPDTSKPQDGSLLADLGKLTVSGALRDTGSAVKGLGVVADTIGQTGRGTTDQPGESRFRKFANTVSGGISGAGDYVADTVSGQMKEAQRATQPGGNILKPSTWHMGGSSSCSTCRSVCQSRGSCA